MDASMDSELNASTQSLSRWDNPFRRLRKTRLSGIIGDEGPVGSPGPTLGTEEGASAHGSRASPGATGQAQDEEQGMKSNSTSTSSGVGKTTNVPTPVVPSQQPVHSENTAVSVTSPMHLAESPIAPVTVARGDRETAARSPSLAPSPLVPSESKPRPQGQLRQAVSLASPGQSPRSLDGVAVTAAKGAPLSPTPSTSSTTSESRAGRFSQRILRQEFARRESEIVNKYENTIALLKTELWQTKEALKDHGGEDSMHSAHSAQSSVSEQSANEPAEQDPTWHQSIRTLSDSLSAVLPFIPDAQARAQFSRDAESARAEYDTLLATQPASAFQQGRVPVLPRPLVHRVIQAQCDLLSHVLPRVPKGPPSGTSAQNPTESPSGQTNSVSTPDVKTVAIIRDLRAELKSSEQRCKDLDALARDRTARLQREMKDWTDMVKALEREVESKNEELRELERSTNELAGQNEVLHKEIVHLRNKSVADTRTLNRLENELSQATEELRHRATVAPPARPSMQARLQQMERDLTSIMTERDRLRGENKELELQMERLADERDMAVGDFAEMSQTAATLQEERKVLQDKVNAMEVEGVLLQQRTVLQKDGLEKVSSDKEELKRQSHRTVADLQSRLEKAVTERDSLSSQHHSILAANTNLRQQLESTHRSHQQRVTELNQEITSLRNRSTDLEKEIQSLKETMAPMTSRLKRKGSSSLSLDGPARRVSFSEDRGDEGAVPASPVQVTKPVCHSVETSTDPALTGQGPNRLLWSHSWTDDDSRALDVQEDWHAKVLTLETDLSVLRYENTRLMTENKRLSDAVAESQRVAISTRVMNSAYMNPLDGVLTGLNRLSLQGGN